jgi:hypothetical protein
MPPVDEEIEDNEELEGGSPETTEKPEPEKEVPADPNEPIQVETDEAKVSRRRQQRAERQNKFRQMEEENQRLRRDVEEIRQRAYQAPQQQYQQSQQQQDSPAAQRLRSLDDTERSLHREYTALAQAGKITPQLQEEFENKARHINVARMATIAQASQPQIDRRAIVQEAMWTQFTTKHADVFHDPNPNIQKWAWAEYHRRIAEGHPDTEDMVEDILDQTRVKFGKQPRRSRGSRPDDNTRARFTGLSSRGGGGSVGEDGMIPMDRDDKRMARIMCSDKKNKDGSPWSEKQAYQYWANTVGKKRAALGKKTG